MKRLLAATAGVIGLVGASTRGRETDASGIERRPGSGHINDASPQFVPQARPGNRNPPPLRFIPCTGVVSERNDPVKHDLWRPMPDPPTLLRSENCIPFHAMRASGV